MGTSNASAVLKIYSSFDSRIGIAITMDIVHSYNVATTTIHNRYIQAENRTKTKIKL
jgi:hypothetical protein